MNSNSPQKTTQQHKEKRPHVKLNSSRKQRQLDFSLKTNNSTSPGDNKPSYKANNMQTRAVAKHPKFEKQKHKQTDKNQT